MPAPTRSASAAGTVTLDGSASYDPDNDPITYAWTQIGGATVTLASPTAAKTTFTAAAGQTYVFKLTVTDSGGLSSSATTRVTASSRQCGPGRALRRDPEQHRGRPEFHS